MAMSKAPEKSDPKVLGKQMETLFLNQFLKIVMEQSDLGKGKMVGNFMPFITNELAKNMAERGIGIADFFMNSPNVKKMLDENSDVVEGYPASGATAGNAGLNNSTGPETLKWDGHLKLPVSGKISSSFGLRHDPINGMLKQHNGIDIAVPEGTPVRPAAPGKVVFSGYSEGYGNCVIVEHENGLRSVYGHNSENKVNAGDIVDKQSVIALSGSTGRSTGPHLHFEVRKGGNAVNPMGMIG
jgi:murein DD-endopeptidase MepM/ murein hydrolase activator NlpD